MLEGVLQIVVEFLRILLTILELALLVGTGLQQAHTA